VRSRGAAALCLAALALLGAGAAGALQDAHGFEGTWTLDREHSEDLAARITEVAGPAHLTGAKTWARDTWLPWNTDFGEPGRVGIREFLLDTVPAFDALEIRPQDGEIHITHGQAGSRIFDLGRKRAGASAMSGLTVRREARLEGRRLVLESKGKDGRFLETLTLESPTRLVYTLRLEQRLLSAPLEARLVYSGGR
jgi:hypothetical protein